VHFVYHFQDDPEHILLHENGRPLHQPHRSVVIFDEQVFSYFKFFPLILLLELLGPFLLYQHFSFLWCFIQPLIPFTVYFCQFLALDLTPMSINDSVHFDKGYWRPGIEFSLFLVITIVDVLILVHLDGIAFLLRCRLKGVFYGDSGPFETLEHKVDIVCFEERFAEFLVDCVHN
jgi:hypothetical protein